MNHQEVFVSPLQHGDILLDNIQVHLDAAKVDSHFFINSHFKEYGFVILEFALQSINHNLNAWQVFSLFVAHSKFSTLLSVLIQLIGFTHCFSLGFGIKAIATNLWTNVLNILDFIYNQTLKYLVHLGFKIIFFQNFKLFTLPKLLTSYNPSYQTTGFHISSIKKILFLLSELKPRTA